MLIGIALLAGAVLAEGVEAFDLGFQNLRTEAVSEAANCGVEGVALAHDRHASSVSRPLVPLDL
eukprot:5444931-Pleurochrysis_carterae.AAC.1